MSFLNTFHTLHLWLGYKIDKVGVDPSLPITVARCLMPHFLPDEVGREIGRYLGPAIWSTWEMVHRWPRPEGKHNDGQTDNDPWHGFLSLAGLVGVGYPQYGRTNLTKTLCDGHISLAVPAVSFYHLYLLSFVSYPIISFFTMLPPFSPLWSNTANAFALFLCLDIANVSASFSLNVFDCHRSSCWLPCIIIVLNYIWE